MQKGSRVQTARHLTTLGGRIKQGATGVVLEVINNHSLSRIAYRVALDAPYSRQEMLLSHEIEDVQEVGNG